MLPIKNWTKFLYKSEKSLLNFAKKKERKNNGNSVFSYVQAFLSAINERDVFKVIIFFFTLCFFYFLSVKTTSKENKNFLNTEQNIKVKN